MKSTLIALAIVVAGTPLALANEPVFPKGVRAFERADANKDGKVELPEFNIVASTRLARMDVNGDKAVSAEEIEARMQENLKKRRDRIMALMDQNRDGAITQSELDKVAEAMFNGADTDKDGGLTMVEMKGFKRGAWRKTYLQSAGGN